MTTPLRERLRKAASTGLANAMYAALLEIPQPQRDEKFIQLMESDDRAVDLDPVTGIVTMTLDGEVFLQTTVEALIGVPASKVPA